MPVVILETRIIAPIERVFDISRSIDLHTRTASATKETAVAGRTSGLIEFGETVTWSAVHFGLRLSHTSEIRAYNRPQHFRDSMVAGVFSRLDHDHYFEETNSGTLMKDVFDYEAPFWIFGRLADLLFLEDYMRDFLEKRNRMIKELAEGEGWRTYLI